MKTKLLLFFMLLGILSEVIAQDLTQTMKPRPADFEYLSAPDSLGVRHQLKMPNLTNRNSLAGSIKIPYPIIFIHGLNSDSNVWNESTNFMDTNFNFTYGGRLDFNLNEDNSNFTSNKLFWPAIGADIRRYPTTLNNGDYYYLNFAVGSNGSFNPSNFSALNVLSNEAAIAKQGVALTRAIQQVMDITGRDKVILFGHSMGGLAAREYLQNPSNWTEPNINSHVAKLITTGTPHGGYTGANFFLATGISSSSEAFRDLRKEYSNSNSGVFLSGGVESTTNIGTSYSNNDINCNGFNNDGIYIEGLNEKMLPTNKVDFAYIMGDCTNCILSQGTILGDGVVRLVNANLGNFYNNLPNPKNEFLYTAFALSEIHSALPKQTIQNMQGLDEPNEYYLAYGVGFNQNYTGFITAQPAGGYAFDYDDYKFTIINTSNVSISINKPTALNLNVKIISNNQTTQIGTIQSNNGSSTINFTQNNLAPGNYFLEIYATPTVGLTSPYIFSLSSTLSTDDFESRNSLVVYPNPTSSKVFFNNSNYNFKEVAIYNHLGQEVAKTIFFSNLNNQEIDMATLPIGVYILKFNSDDVSQSIKIIKK